MEFLHHKRNIAPERPMFKLNQIRRLLVLAIMPAMITAALTVCATAVLAASPVRERLSFDSDWRFTKGDPAGISNELSYPNIKPWVMANGNEFVKDGTNVSRPSGDLGADVSYIQPGWNDATWRSLTLPQDWGIAGPFDIKLPGETAKLPWAGIGWYRKHFDIPASDAGRKIYLDLDGAMSYANVWLNGHYVGGWPYGYASWEVDLTPYIKFGGANVLAIRLDNPLGPPSRCWYPGGGIDRNVWLSKTCARPCRSLGNLCHDTRSSMVYECHCQNPGCTADNDADSDCRRLRKK